MVVTNFSDDHIEHEDDHGLPAAKRLKGELHDDCLSAQAQRQKAWINRHGEDVTASMWRPVTYHRVAAKKWALCIDKQVVIGTVRPGLLFFQRTSSGLWKDWRKWPLLGIGHDMASDGVCGIHAFLRYLWLHVLGFGDQSHSCARSFEAVLRELGLWDFWLLFIISLNLLHGPHQDQERRHELRASLDSLYKHREPHDTPVFLQLAPEMRRQLAEGGIASFDSHSDPDRALWDWLKSRNRFGSIGRRSTLARYGGTQHATKQQHPYWAVHEFERTILSMESDMLKGTKFTESLTSAAGPSDVGEGSTRPRLIYIENRSLRGCCGNVVVVSLRTLTEHSHYRLVSTLLELDTELQDYHTDQNKESRSVPNNVKWITKQCGGGFISHLNKFLNCLFDVQKQMKAGLQMPGCDGSVLPRGAITDLERQDMELENEYAAVYGDGAFAFMVARTERNLWMVGWPFRFFGCIDGSVEFIESTLRAFKRDLDIFKEFEAFDEKSQKVAEVQDRHLFFLLACKRYILAFQELGFDSFHGDIRTITEEAAATYVPTQIVEDINGEQAVLGSSGQGKRFRKPAACMAKALHAQVVDVRHKYKNVAMDTPVPSIEAKVPNTAFNLVNHKPSIAAINTIASTSAKPPFFSPRARDAMVPHADLQLLSDGKDEGFGMMNNAWLGQVACLRHHIAFAWKSKTYPFDLEWFVGLKHFPASAMYVMPAKLHSFPETNYQYLEVARTTTQITLKSLLSTDPECVRAACWSWKSWRWQSRTLPAAGHRLTKAVRIFVDRNGEASVELVMGLHAFWNLPLQPFGKAVETSGSTFDVVFDGVKGITAKSDVEVLEIIYRWRIVEIERNSKHSEALLEIDEAIEVVDTNDRQKIIDRQKQANGELGERADFMKRYQGRVRTTRDGGHGGGGGGAVHPPVGRRRIPHHCSQAEAKTFLPPGAYIWRDRDNNGWCGHYKPHRRCSDRFSKHGGSDGALRAIIGRLWTQYLTHKALDKSHCTVEGLFA